MDYNLIKLRKRPNTGPEIVPWEFQQSAGLIQVKRKEPRRALVECFFSELQQTSLLNPANIRIQIPKKHLRIHIIARHKIVVSNTVYNWAAIAPSQLTESHPG